MLWNTLAYVLKRFSEPSSYAGLAAVAAPLGLHFSDQMSGQIGLALAGVCGLLSLLLQEKGVVKSLVLVFGLSAMLGLSACGEFQKYVDQGSAVTAKFEATASGKSVLTWLKAFKPKVEAAVARIEADLTPTADEIKFMCGGANVLDTAFNATVLFVQVPSGAVELERLGFKGIQAACAWAEKGTVPTGTAFAKYWRDTKAELAKAGLKL